MKRFFFVFPLVLFWLWPLFPVEGAEHPVKKGETALQIAIDHNLTLDQLAQLNPDTDLEMMRVGDILIVPDEDSSSFDDFLGKRYGDLIRITDLNCRCSPGGSAGCLFRAENLGDQPLYDVRFKASVRGSSGKTGQAEAAIALMQILPGEKLPVYIGIPGDFGSGVQPSVSVVNLAYNEKMQGSFRIPQDRYTVTETLSPDGISAASAIRFDSEGIAAYQNKKINVLSAAFDADGKLVGVRSLYSDFYPGMDITVYSAGEPIRTVEIRIEAY